MVRKSCLAMRQGSHAQLWLPFQHPQRCRPWRRQSVECAGASGSSLHAAWRQSQWPGQWPAAQGRWQPASSRVHPHSTQANHHEPLELPHTESMGAGHHSAQLVPEHAMRCDAWCAECLMAVCTGTQVRALMKNSCSPASSREARPDDP